MNESIKIEISVNDLNIIGSGILHMKDINDTITFKLFNLEVILEFKNESGNKEARTTITPNGEDQSKGKITVWNIATGIDGHAIVPPLKMGSIDSKELYVSLDITEIALQKVIGYIFYTKKL